MNVPKYLLLSRMRTLFESHTSLWISSRVSKFLVIEWKGVRTYLPWTHISQLEDESKEDLGVRFKLIIFLMELKLTYPNLPCQMSEDSIFKATGIEILLSEWLITLSWKRPSQIKLFPNKIFDLEITSLLDCFQNPITNSKKRRFTDQISPKRGYMQDVLKSKNHLWGHSEINGSSSLYLSSGIICQVHASSMLFW